MSVKRQRFRELSEDKRAEICTYWMKVGCPMRELRERFGISEAVASGCIEYALLQYKQKRAADQQAILLRDAQRIIHNNNYA